VLVLTKPEHLAVERYGALAVMRRNRDEVDALDPHQSRGA